MSRIIPLVVATVLSLGVAGKWPGPEPRQDSAASQDAADGDLAKEAQKILRQRCFHCHGLNGQAEANVFVLDRDRLIADKVVEPGRETSKLLRVTIAGLMPADLAERDQKLPEAEIETLRKWIVGGAPRFEEKKEEARKFLSDAALTADVERDLKAADKRARQFLRYFSIAHLYNAGVSGDELEGYRIGLSKLLNSLSWQQLIAIPAPINPSKTILRIDLRDFKWEPGAWNRVLAAYPYGYRPRGAEAIQELSGAEVPFVRADWMVARASVPPLYHDLLDLPKDLASLEARLQVDVKRDLEDEHGVARAGIRNSGVSRNNRVVERHNSAFGAYWKSYDFSSSQGEHDMFRNPLDLKPAGGEMVFNLPNGMQGYLIVNAQDVRIDEAPVSIVSDRTQPDDPIVRNGVSCMGCHYAGMKPFQDDVRAGVAGSPGQLDREKILALYPEQARLDELLEKDAKRFSHAIEEAGGKVSADHRTEPINRLSRKYKAQLSLELAAAEAGHEVAAFKEKLIASPVLTQLGITRQLVNPNPGIKRDTWEENFGAVVKELALGEGAESRASRPAFAATLLPEQEALREFTGRWEGSSTYKFADGTTKTARAKEVSTLLFGGVILHMHSEETDPSGTEELRDLLWYDRFKKKHQAIQISASSPLPTLVDATWDPEARTFSSSAPQFQFEDGTNGSFRTVYLFRDRDTRIQTGSVHGSDGQQLTEYQSLMTRAPTVFSLPSGNAAQRATPSEERATLARFVGSWTGTVTVHVDGTTRTGTVTEVGRLICEGAWLEASRVIQLGGVTVGILQFAGYDPRAEKFRIVRCDSFGIVDQGEGADTDEDSGRIEGETYDDAGRRVKWTEVISFPSDRRRLVTRTLFDAQGQPRVRLEMELSKS